MTDLLSRTRTAKPPAARVLPQVGLDAHRLLAAAARCAHLHVLRYELGNDDEKHCKRLRQAGPPRGRELEPARRPVGKANAEGRAREPAEILQLPGAPSD